MNLVTGDYIEFTLPQYEGGTFSQQGQCRHASGSRYVGDKAFQGTIERDWFDTKRRHWFSIRLPDGKLKRAQGKNLYPGVRSHVHGPNHAEAATGKQLGKEFFNREEEIST
jgi:hypothetical protein